MEGVEVDVLDCGQAVVVAEIDPICALQASMEGYEVRTVEEVVNQADVFVTATGCCDVIKADHMARMKDKAIVCNIGHFDNEIDMAGLAKCPGVEKKDMKPEAGSSGGSVQGVAKGRTCWSDLRL